MIINQEINKKKYNKLDITINDHQVGTKEYRKLYLQIRRDYVNSKDPNYINENGRMKKIRIRKIKIQKIKIKKEKPLKEKRIKKPEDPEKRKEYNKLYNQNKINKNPDCFKITSKKNRIANFEKHMFYQIKSSAKKRRMEFNLTIDDFVIPSICPVLNIKLTRTVGEGKSPFNPSIDRIDNNKGYIKGNVMIISNKANTMKSDATKEELISFANYIIKNLI